MADRPLGLYVHVPWCRSLCPYCDFPVAVASPDAIPHRAYRDAILTELAQRAGDFAGRQLVSIYFGGGTPSLWRTDCLRAVIDQTRATFASAPGDLEITIEANPSDCTAENLAEWRGSGIGRVSIGVQSMEPRELVALGRDHRMGDGAAAVRAAVAAGMPRVSADIIFGVPGSLMPGDPGGTAEMAEAERCAAHVGRVAALGPGHLSVYELTIEERTAFGR
ncbi:MAG: radical SAM protein, partial [Myxococcota bacterium]